MNTRTLLTVLLVSAPLWPIACASEDPGDEPGAGGSAPALTSDSYSEAELTRMVSYLASDELAGRDEGTPGGLAARAFLVAELERCGLEPAGMNGFEQPIVGGNGANLIARVPGTDAALADRHVLVSAHYDHLGACDGDICNGADDNAAGVSIAVGIACAVAHSPLKRSLLFAAWDAEEPPSFLSVQMGSQYYVSNPTVPLEQIDVAIVMDLVGSDMWPGFAGHVLLGAELSPQVRAAVDAAPKPAGLEHYRAGLHLAEEQPLGLGRQPWSDYDAFRNANKPILFLSNGQNKRYHTPDDEVAALNLPKMVLEAEHLLGVVKNLGDATETPAFDAAGTDYATDAATVRAVLERALAAGGLVDSLALKPESRATLEADLGDVMVIEQQMGSGATPNEQQVRRLRDGTQHVMCMAGSSYGEDLCNAF